MDGRIDYAYVDLDSEFEEEDAYAEEEQLALVYKSGMHTIIGEFHEEN